MIDIDELRRLAQAATPGPWHATKSVETNSWAVWSDTTRLMELRPTKTVDMYQVSNTATFIAAANPTAVSELIDRLEAAEKNNSAWLYANAPGGWIDNLRVKCEALRARIAQVDRQEPVAWMCSDKALIQMGYKKFSDRCEGSWDIPVFAGVPGAKGEDK